MIDTSSLSKAIEQVEEALEYAASPLAASDPKLGFHLRAAAIQAFEFTYDLTIKTLQRHLASVDASPSLIDDLDFSGVIRLGFKRGLLREEVATWREFRKSRNITSHTYDDAKAQDVFDAIPDFLREARFVRDEIQARQARTS